MKLFEIAKDGGKDSNVTGFWLCEFKSLFSIVFLRFSKGSRESFHSHAFNALTWFLWGNVDEYHIDGRKLNWKGAFKPKYTPRDCFHKIFANKTTYALSFRGPWSRTWKEYSPKTNKYTTLKNGRVIVEQDE